MVSLSSECWESKVKYPAPWAGKGGKASASQGLPWGIDSFHLSLLFVCYAKLSTFINMRYN
jgi:hypothetical protein